MLKFFSINKIVETNFIILKQTVTRHSFRIFKLFLIGT